MNIQRLSRSELIDISAQEEIIKATAQQIIKDFAEFGFEINFSGNTANFYTELFSQMEESVKDLIANQQTKFYSFLYRIDISNKEMALYEQEMAGQPKSTIITELIIHREIKKVLYRIYYSSNQNSK
ncbi:MAG: hypothetical protein KBG80_07070 [Breznakibacter sp.]|nr:hypothetical protein [Breznakibacter sp.]